MKQCVIILVTTDNETQVDDTHYVHEYAKDNAFCQIAQSDIMKLISVIMGEKP